MIEVLLLVLRISPLLIGPFFFISGGANPEFFQIKMLFVLLTLMLGWETLYTGTIGIRNKTRSQRLPRVFVVVGIAFSLITLNLLRGYIEILDFYILLGGIGATIIGRRTGELDHPMWSATLFFIGYSALTTLGFVLFSPTWQWQFLPIGVCFGALAAGTELMSIPPPHTERRRRTAAFLLSLGPVTFASLVFGGQLPRIYFLILTLAVVTPLVMRGASRPVSRGWVLILPFSFLLLLCTIRVLV